MTTKNLKSKDFKIMIQCLIVIDGKNKPEAKRKISRETHTFRLKGGDNPK